MERNYQQLPPTQLNAMGTPIPMKSPINFESRLAAQKKTNEAAMKKLCLVMFVSVFFITA